MFLFGRLVSKLDLTKGSSLRSSSLSSGRLRRNLLPRCYLVYYCWYSFWASPAARAFAPQTRWLRHHSCALLLPNHRALPLSRQVISKRRLATMTPHDNQDDEPVKAMRRSSPRKGKVAPDGNDEVPVATTKKKATKKATASPKTTKTARVAKVSPESGKDEPDPESSPKKLAPRKKKVDATELPTASTPTKSAPKRSKSESGDESPPKKKKAPAHQVLTERDPIPKLWHAAEHKESYTFKIASWNVAGLRAVMKKDPDAVANLIARLDLDVLCLQETKLQESHLNDPKVTLPKVEGYDAHYSCSTAKKGYSGTAAFIRKRGKPKKKGKQTTMDAFVKGSKTKEQDSTKMALPVDEKYLIPEQVSMEMGVSKHDQEGRIIVMDFPLFSLVNLYVPNSGQKLERLDYRTKEWDKDLVAFMQSKQKDRGVPVLWLGDLNVAHTNLEVWNDGAKHLPKQAGVTVEERESFQTQLDAGFVDAFRKLHPDAKGHYTYWSQRAGNRAPNKGLRLDYFVCDPQFFQPDTSQVVTRDSYMVEDQEGSDHCPAVLEIEIKK